jgi:hypothetical protein
MGGSVGVGTGGWKGDDGENGHMRFAGAFLCDEAEFVDGSLNVRGLARDGLTASRLPCAIGQVLVLILELAPEELQPDRVFAIAGEIQLGGGEPTGEGFEVLWGPAIKHETPALHAVHRVRWTASLEDLRVHDYGWQRIVVTVDGNESTEVPFFVASPEDVGLGQSDARS